MKNRLGLISLAAAAVLMTACNDTDTNVTTTEAQSYTIKGDVNGCVVAPTSGNSLAEGADIPLSGVTASVGNQSATTGQDGCFSINNVTITEMKTADSDDTRDTTITVVLNKDGYETEYQSDLIPNSVVGGVLADFGGIWMNPTDPGNPTIVQFPEDQLQAGIMLVEGVDGLANPIVVEMSENVNLADGLNEGINVAKLVEVNGTTILDEDIVMLETTIQTSFNAENNQLSISTSVALDAGAVYGIAVPVQQITDMETNFLEDSGFTDDFVEGDISYVAFEFMIFSQTNNEAQAPTNLTMMREDVNSLKTDSEALAAISGTNASFLNVAKGDVNNLFSFANNQNSAYTDLLNEHLTAAGDPIVATVNAARITFTPSNAAYYEVSAEDNESNPVTFNLVEQLGAENFNFVGSALELEAIGTDPVELVLTGLTPTDVLTVTPYSYTDQNGTTADLTLADNVVPTTSLQYSYNFELDSGETNTTYTPGVTTGEVTAIIYGGSGELSNGTEDDNLSTSPNEYAIGTPYLDLVIYLVRDQSATNANTYSLPFNGYTESDFETWSNDLNRTIGVGFTEAVNVTGAEVLNGVNTITGVATVQDDQLVGGEHLVLVSTNNILSFANDNNGTVLRFNGVEDLTGNAADKADVVLRDRMWPFVVSTDINKTTVTGNIVTFTEAMAAGSLTVGGITCNVNDGNVSGNIVSLDGCDLSTLPAGSNIIDFSTIPDANGNSNIYSGLPVWTFDANVTQ